MYKYARQIRRNNGTILLIMYYLLVLKVNMVPGQRGTELYAKIRWWHPAVWLLTMVMLLIRIAYIAIKVVIKVTKELVDFFRINDDNYKNGILLGFYKED